MPTQTAIESHLENAQGSAESALKLLQVHLQHNAPRECEPLRVRLCGKVTSLSAVVHSVTKTVEAMNHA